ncbi:UNVERIFIED_CONTAM: hypothetical protein RMT77_006223 [Armadillidium vulgare]
MEAYISYSFSSAKPNKPWFSTISRYLVRSLKVFHKNGPRFWRGYVSGTSVLLTGLTFGSASLISHLMITVSVEGDPRNTLSP